VFVGALSLVGGRPWSQLKMVLISSPMGEENGLSMATERRSRGEEHQSSIIHDPLSPHTQAHVVHTKTNAHTDYVHMYLNVNNFAFHIYTFLLHS